MVDVELRHLTTMAAIVEEGTFGRAAARLGYTQSTVSQQIAALEKSVGGAVFDRPGGPRPVRITPLGAVVLDHGRDLLAKAEALADAVERFRAGDGRIDIGTFQSVSDADPADSVVRRLLRRAPRLRHQAVRGHAGGCRSSATWTCCSTTGRIDGDVEHVKLVDDPYLLVARPGELPDGPVRLERLDDAPMVAAIQPATSSGWSGARRRRRAAPDRLPHRRATRRSCRWCGPGWARRCCRGSPSTDPTPGPTTGSASTNCDRRRPATIVPALAGRAHAVAARDPDHRGRRRSRRRAGEADVTVPLPGAVPRLGRVAHQHVRQLFRAAECDAVAARDLVGNDAQAVGYQPAKEVGREEAVLAAEHEPRRHVRPRIQRPRSGRSRPWTDARAPCPSPPRPASAVHRGRSSRRDPRCRSNRHRARPVPPPRSGSRCWPTTRPATHPATGSCRPAGPARRRAADRRPTGR